ncbi:hypothetical protein [Geobacter sp. SVR]|uniref:hypothetical protein n=1 Tax=Geobacter sp. SVR TaxID=2495594 RepID=UPI001567B97B|nr:hypothetical protein [Geobacter sp. SVR]
MSHEFIEPDFEKLNAIFTERTRWANLSVTIEEITKENKRLIHDLSRYDPTIAVPLLASLLTLPEYQSHCMRFEVLVTLAVTHCRGRKKANISQAVRWFSLIGKSQCMLGEDPAEDVFVSLVQDSAGNYRLLEGVWEAAGFYTQRVLDVIATMPDTGQFGQIKKSVRALLVISDIVCEKAGVHRYQLGSAEHYTELSLPKLLGRNTLISRVSITFSELEENNITLKDIKPFLFYPQMREDLPAQQIGLSYLDRCPLIVFGEKHLTVVLPQTLSVAVRDYAITSIIKGGLTETFDGILAQNYSKLFFDTPLLGGPIQAPVHWKKSSAHRWSHLFLEIDKGYVISLHLFLPSVRAHQDGGFKEVYRDEGSITEVLQASINEALMYFEGKDDFKKGLVVLVGCGWGKGYETQWIEMNHPHWRFESMSAADLVRLSWLSDMNPGYFWRIQDGLEAVGKAGVQIVNPNGILNLIGWVRSNNGHFVSHAQLPQGEISPERPLMLAPPLNLLREVRADSDRGYDRHSALDNVGTRHEVQHVSPNPFFSSESARCVYASMNDIRGGTLTSVYEGAIKLWVSVSTPNASERNVAYRLWEMASEWLHRIGNALDKHREVAKEHNLKVYVEFRDDDPTKEGDVILAHEDLFRLCMIEPHSEPNAYKAIFQTGFLAAFRIADNVAERLFVRTLARAYLTLLDVENCCGEAEVIEALVVPNNEARNFHLFYAQQFMDYVRDTLPKKLIAIDSVDDAAMKIGLGWRVLKKGQSNKIEGKEACTDFLGKVVDVLLSEIIELLKTFDRISALRRLVANCEKANTEEDHWKRTSAAVLGLHGDEPGTVDRYVEQMSKFAGANIASRILTEISLCACPTEGGIPLSDIELSKLIVRAAFVVGIGGLSDAIYYNALAPELTISPLGDLLFRDEFGQSVVEPMLTREIGNRFITNAPLQRGNYENPQIVPQTKGHMSDEFLNIWKIEMGFDLDEARNIIDELEDKGINDHAAIFMIKKREYLALVCSDKVHEDAARKFLDQFSLSTRPYWDKPPKGFSGKDIYPWRFGRRLSFATRPILIVDDSDDPLLIIAPGALRTGFIYVLNGAYYGQLEQDFFRTKEMRDTWWGKASEGHTFNAEVSKALSDAGWQVRQNIGLPELLNRKIERNFGDVDVFAWRTDRKEVLVIECKDLSLARNYSEIAALLSGYQGAEISGKADNLKKHLDRFSLLHEHGRQVQRFTGVKDPQIVSCLVCSGVVPMQYAKIDALEHTHVGGISEILELLV